MSRFFKGSDSDSSSSDSSDDEIYSDNERAISEEESSSEDESSLESGGESDAPKKKSANRFLRGGESDESDSDDAKRIVKSAKDKRMGEVEACIKVIENAEKINDWSAISVEFDKLNKVVQKVSQSGKTPRIYIKAVADLEEFMNETLQKEKDAKKKLNATNARALNQIKQRIRKNNRAYDQEILKYRADPEAFEEEEEVYEEVKRPKSKPGEDEIIVDGVSRRGILADGDDEGFATVGRGGKAVLYTPEGIFKHLTAIFEARGKKNTDRSEQIKVLEKLRDVAHTSLQKIAVLLALISARFDLSAGTAVYMTVEHWKAAETEINILIDVLETDRSFVIVDDGMEINEDELPQPGEDGITRVRGNVMSFVDRLDDELTRSLQNIDPHTSEYIDRLKNETSLYNLLLGCQILFERIDPGESLNRVVSRRLERLYFKEIITTLEQTTWSSLPSHMDSFLTPRSLSIKSSELIHILCVHLYKKGTGLSRTRAMLCHIYHHALHNRYHKARDMLLMSHLQESVHLAEVNTQTLHNRTMVQLGLCAFRLGMVSESHSCLQEICAAGKLKELLAQGIQSQRYSQTTPEQERLERQRQLPFHMHINLELIECVYLTCSMLLEIPNMAAAGTLPEFKKKVISKPFRRMLDYHERQVFVGPPENMRDHIMQASKAFSNGDWVKTKDLIRSVRIWDIMPQSESIKEMLTQRIQEEGLRTYLFSYCPFYDTLSISAVAGMFDLPEDKAMAIMSRMIMNEEIPASLDNIDKTVIFHRIEISRLQTLALTLTEKTTGLADANQKLVEAKAQGQGEGQRRPLRHDKDKPARGRKVEFRNAGRAVRT
ncbi:Eukaryotic translation initiation factor 3 subunit C [Neolecta irregularis DAH-3]|uniref:Eukaryotic translation initiation factor 3 subunit C n=1 Tax=Neolecta irregularis (strain DAH-3) TaxID=1198029 RepID=A0A1U7LG59_NEOID|nr:Eukaryotic translation initiation factor 3 subunit C [Neolecta irregularis DAH-3]|eukprot:OLL21640.1 Eukaryotic translation initiation factor 3 subunit C [Neolecta irregularis DAH-3]